MKLIDLERHLRQHGCRLVREGGAHTLWGNPLNRKVAPVPRHREIKEGTVRAVCRNSRSRRRDRPCVQQQAHRVAQARQALLAGLALTVGAGLLRVQLAYDLREALNTVGPKIRAAVQPLKAA